MKKSIWSSATRWVSLSVLLSVGLLGAVTSVADEASVKKAIEAAYPKIKVDSVTKTNYAGLYEIFMGGQIIYTDEKFSFLIAEGRLVDPKTKKDITGDRLDELTKIDFNSLPLDQAIKVVKGNGSRKLVVFSDVDCPFCKRLEQNELTKINDVTIYTFLYPIEQLHPDAANKSRSIWCASNRVKAWQEWIFNNKLPSSTAKCEVPLEKVGELAHKIGVNSTPTMFFENGKRMLGAQPSDEIEKALQTAKK
ncbi:MULTISPECIES: DsbC family protein [unclassified Methylophilus]|jgi:thiol:disulfide interchange protein DsbC|uniref:DsbC family protein n=1 Tax=unclassified Methylophilus TaxID=2630143 RepID=UPI0006FF7384|nr:MULTISPECIES: DsbC family protein [unclassified Methylophilus]KQT41677.1 thiol:disulfide interchange protein [Methylophilus sp. Leaf416]KQT55844.1 thiol:disulfide interchange protein [Methylophilus sp. Leaf459]